MMMKKKRHPEYPCQNIFYLWMLMIPFLSYNFMKNRRMKQYQYLILNIS